MDHSSHTGGTGARVGKDGLSATAFPSGVRNTPVEINETISPLVFWRKEYRTDSGGAGRHRGGTGQVMEISHRENAPFSVGANVRPLRPSRARTTGGRAGRQWRGTHAERADPASEGSPDRPRRRLSGARRHPVAAGSATRRRVRSQWWRKMSATGFVTPRKPRGTRMAWWVDVHGTVDEAATKVLRG